jgi:hypothetical protein
MKARIQILHIAVNAGRSKKTGNDYDMRMAQCIVHGRDKDGNTVPLVGELLLPEQFKDTPPGDYEVDFEIGIGQNKRVEGKVFSINPWVVKAASAPVQPAVKPV